MTRYILQRLALLPLLMVIYSFVIFVIIQAPPGDFLTAYVATLASSGSSLSAEQIAAMRHQYGLDQPMIVQYFLWVQHLLHGDFGLSLEYQRPNAELINEMLGLTLAQKHDYKGAVEHILNYLRTAPAEEDALVAKAQLKRLEELESGSESGRVGRPE